MKTTESDRVINYTYDDAGRLTREKVTSGANTIQTDYTYDAAGNRLSAGSDVIYTYNNRNQLTSDGVYAYVYDAFGNLTDKKIGDISYFEYSYDPFGRLCKVLEQPGGQYGAEQTYAYDGDGKRIALVNTKAQTTRYVYDGEQIILELDSGGEQSARYIYGHQLVLHQKEPKGGGTKQTVYYSYNGHGDTVRLWSITLSPSYMACYTYDAFGNMVEEKNPGALDEVKSDFLYAGYQKDATGLYYLRNRIWGKWKICRIESYRNSSRGVFPCNR